MSHHTLKTKSDLEEIFLHNLVLATQKLLHVPIYRHVSVRKPRKMELSVTVLIKIVAEG